MDELIELEIELIVALEYARACIEDVREIASD